MSLANMEKNHNTGFFNIYIYGLFVWLIPFVIAFFLYTPQGTPYIGEAFFKSMMFIVGTIVACVFLLMHFKRISREFFKEGAKAGVVWVVMSVILDLLFLIPFTKSDLGAYFLNIALGYGAILVICIFTGLLLEEKGEHSKKLYSQIFSAK